MSDVYVSYANADRERACQILDALRKAGLDPLDGQALPADVDPDMAEEAMPCLLVLWSRGAAEEPDWVQREMRHIVKAWSSDRLVLSALDDAPLPTGLGDLHATPAGDLRGLVARVRQVAHPPPEPSPDAGAARPQVIARGRPPPSRAPVRTALAALAAIVVISGLAVAWLFLQRSSAPPPRHEYYPQNLPAPAPPRPASPQHQPAAPAEPAEPKASAPPSGGEVQLEESLPLLIGVLLVGALGGFGLNRFWGFWRSRPATPQPVASPSASPQPAPAAGEIAGKVFVSYSHKDGAVVEGLVEKIEGMGYPVWIDREAGGSQRYAGPIVGAIRGSKLVALMCSQSAFASDHVIREVYVAGDFKKPFIAFQLDSSDFPDEILYFLTGFPRVPIGAVTPDQLRADIARLAGSR